MFKRLIWWSTGALMGAGGSWWAKRKVKRAVQVALDDARIAIQPGVVADAAKRRVSRAVQAGRWAAEDRERALKIQLESIRSGETNPQRALR